MSDRLRGRQDDYRRALADPVRFDVAFYAGLYAEALEAEVERLQAREQFLTRFLHAIYTARNITIDQDRLNEAMVLLDAWGRAHSQGNGEEDNEQLVRDQESRMRQWLYAPPPTREPAP